MSIRKQLFVLFTAGWLTAAAVSAPAVASERLDPADLLPRTTSLLVRLDVEGMVSKFGTLDLVRLYHDEEVQDFIQPAIEYLESQWTFREAGAVRFMMDSYGFPAIVKGSVTAAIAGFGVVKDQGRVEWYASDAEFTEESAASLANTGLGVVPDLLLVVETAGRESFESSFERLLELPPGGAKTTSRVAGAVTYQTSSIESADLPGGALALHHGFVGDLFVLGLHEESLVGLMGRLEAGKRPQESLSGDAAYRSWRETSAGGNELLEVYFGLGHAFRSLMPFIDNAGLREYLASTGFDGVEGAGYALSFEQGAVHESCALVLEEERRGCLRLLDALRPSPALVAGIPATATSALALGLDCGRLLDRLEEFWDEVSPWDAKMLREDNADLARETGIDPRGELLPALGERAVVHATLPRTGFIPEVAGSLAIRDHAQAASVLARLRDLVERESDGEVRVEEVTVGEQEGGLYFRIPEAPVAPALLLGEDRLSFASSVRCLKQNAGGSKGPSLADGSEDFKGCLAAAVGRHTDDLALVFYVDVARGVEQVLGLSEMFLPMILGELPFELDAGLMPLPDTVSGYLSGMLVTLRSNDRVVVLDILSPVGGLLPLLCGPLLIFSL